MPAPATENMSVPGRARRPLEKGARPLLILLLVLLFIVFPFASAAWIAVGMNVPKVPEVDREIDLTD